MRLIDADTLLEELKKSCKWHAESSRELSLLQRNINIAKEQPTVDAVRVIRCKDCKFLRFTGTVWKCQNRLVMMLCEPNDYCSRAERKEE